MKSLQQRTRTGGVVPARLCGRWIGGVGLVGAGLTGVVWVLQIVVGVCPAGAFQGLAWFLIYGLHLCAIAAPNPCTIAPLHMRNIAYLSHSSIA